MGKRNGEVMKHFKAAALLEEEHELGHQVFRVYSLMHFLSNEAACSGRHPFLITMDSLPLEL